MNVDEILKAVTPEVYEKFKLAIELGKWENGDKLSPQQRQTCMQAVIAYESRHVAEDERVGYIPPKVEPCEDSSHIHTLEEPISWKNNDD